MAWIDIDSVIEHINKMVEISAVPPTEEDYAAADPIEAYKQEGYCDGYTTAASDIQTLLAESVDQPIEVLPCPFCGQPAELKQIEFTYTINPVTLKNKYKVGCQACNIYTPLCTSNIWQDEYGFLHVDANGAEIAANLWNKRAKDESTDDGSGENTSSKGG